MRQDGKRVNIWCWFSGKDVVNECKVMVVETDMVVEVKLRCWGRKLKREKKERHTRIRLLRRWKY